MGDRGHIPRDPAWCSFCIEARKPCGRHRGPTGEPAPYAGPDVYTPTSWVLSVVGGLYRAFGGQIVRCFGYDPRHGFWIEVLYAGNIPGEEEVGSRRNVSERAIDRTLHRLDPKHPDVVLKIGRAEPMVEVEAEHGGRSTDDGQGRGPAAQPAQALGRLAGPRGAREAPERPGEGARPRGGGQPRRAGAPRVMPVLCTACDPDGWQCEREPHSAGTYHAIGLARGAEVELDETGEPTNADRAWLGTVRRHETANAVLRVLLEGACVPKYIAERTGLAFNTVRKHLTELRKAGLAEPCGDDTWMG